MHIETCRSYNDAALGATQYSYLEHEPWRIEVPQMKLRAITLRASRLYCRKNVEQNVPLTVYVEGRTSLGYSARE